MIRKLRRRHRATFTVLCVLLPVGFVAALAARPEFPVGQVTADSEVAASYAPLPTMPLEAPDVLVYLVGGEFPGESSGDALPDGARLLGVYAPKVRLPLPEGLESGVHTLIYFSLGHAEIVHTETL